MSGAVAYLYAYMIIGMTMSLIICAGIYLIINDEEEADDEEFKELEQLLKDGVDSSGINYIFREIVLWVTFLWLPWLVHAIVSSITPGNRGD